MAGIGQTALAIQHEVNNPLAALLGNVQLMLMDDALADRRARARRRHARAGAPRGERGEAALALEAPKTVEYLTGEPMLDLSERAPALSRSGPTSRLCNSPNSSPIASARAAAHSFRVTRASL